LRTRPPGARSRSIATADAQLHSGRRRRYRADLDAVVEFGIFVEGASRSGKTNVVRVFLEQTYGLFQHIVVDVEGEYVTLRSAERPYLIVGRGRDIALPVDADAIKRLVLTIVAKGVSVIFDLSEHDIEEQQPIVAAICDALVSLPENHPGNAAVVLEELQDFAPEGGGKGTALSSVRRLSKRGLKRGFFTVGVSQRVADVSKGVITQLKNKIIGGTDLKDAPRALEELGLPAKEKSAVTDLAQGDFWVKGPAFARHAQLVRPPRSVTAPPKRKRGEPPAPAPKHRPRSQRWRRRSPRPRQRNHSRRRGARARPTLSTPGSGPFAACAISMSSCSAHATKRGTTRRSGTSGTAGCCTRRRVRRAAASWRFSASSTKYSTASTP
jgi:hypothetical protein